MRLKEAGVIWTYPNKCNPLEDVRIIFEWNPLNGQEVSFEISDGDHKPYFSKTVKSKKGRVELTVRSGATAGVHLIKAKTKRVTPAQTSWEDKEIYSRCGSFRVEVKTKIIADDNRINDLFCLLEESLKQAVDIVKVKGKLITYHKHADNYFENLAYPAFAVSSMRYFFQDVKTMFEIMYENQWPNGKLPDHIYGDGNEGWGKKKERKIRTCMGDLEPGTVSTLYKGWQAHGDNEWVKMLLPKMEKGLKYVTTDPILFDKKYRLIKRPHTCDEWDFQIFDGSCFVNKNTHFVVMQGDTSSMYEACGSLAALYLELGNKSVIV